MATFRNAVGALYGTVASTANAVSGGVQAAGTTMIALNSYVQNMASQQQSRMKADNEIFLDELVKAKAAQIAESDLNEQEFRGRSTDHAKFYDAAKIRMQKLLLAKETPAE
jgi:hypothetical protein